MPLVRKRALHDDAASKDQVWETHFSKFALKLMRLTDWSPHLPPPSLSLSLSVPPSLLYLSIPLRGPQSWGDFLYNHLWPCRAFCWYKTSIAMIMSEGFYIASTLHFFLSCSDASVWSKRQTEYLPPTHTTDKLGVCSTTVMVKLCVES